MKSQAKLLAAATLLAAGSANAAIDNSTTGNGELFFAIWNTTVKSTYVKDLGIRMDDFTGRTNLSFDLANDNYWTQFLGSVDVNDSKNQWMIGAMDSTDSAFTGGMRVLSTSNSTNFTNQTNLRLSDFALADSLLQTINGKGTHPTQANGSSFTSALVDGARAYAGSGVGSHNMATWESRAQGWTSSTHTSAGNYLSFYSIVNSNGDDGLAQPVFAKFVDDAGVAQKWSVDLAGNSLDWNAGTIVTPIPAAAWLLGSALFGLVGFGRWKKTRK